MKMTKALLAKALLVVLALSHLTCNQAIPTADADATLTLFVNPRAIAAHGGISVVSAFVTDGTGFPVPDGTVVQFFTTLGRIDEQGRTNDGVARVNLTADSRSGTAEITAFSGAAATDTEQVDIGGNLPTTVRVRAEPSIITSGRSSRIVATVIDADGNPVPNQAVVFAVTGTPPSSTEYIESFGEPRFTDNNGEAEDTLRTRLLAGGVSTATVTATVLGAGAATGSVTVVLQLQ